MGVDAIMWNVAEVVSREEIGDGFNSGVDV